VRTILWVGLLAALCCAENSAIALLETATRDVDRGVRFAAVEALGKAGAGIEAIVAALDDPEWCVRQAAGRALSNIGEPALPRIDRLYKEGKPRTRLAAVEAARRIGPKGAPTVIAALDDKDAAVRREAIDGVVLIGKVDWTAAQIARLRKLADSENADRKLNACLALHLSDPDARGLVAEHVGDLRAMVEPRTRQQRSLDVLEAWLAPAQPPDSPEIELHGLASINELVRSSELAVIRRMGAKFKQHEEAIAKLLGSQQAGVARDAAIALGLIGANAIAHVTKHGPARAAFACDAPSPAERNAIIDRIRRARLKDEELADWVLQLARMRLNDDEDAKAILREMASWKHARVRANAVWGLGEIGIEVPEALGDRSLAVREIALPYIKNVARLTAILKGTHREARILAARRLGQLDDREALLAVSSHPDPLLRIAVAQALVEHCPTSYAKDESRDVRIAAASVLRAPVLLYMLKDKNWRVRAAAVRSLGHAKLGVDELALLLGSRNYAIGMAAFEALERIGPSAAVAVGRAVDNGNESVWQYAPKLFDSFGGAGAAGVAALIGALTHPNPTARETAARCIASVGTDAARACPALMEALADRRLAVVSHASLALGRIGITEPLLGGLDHKRARVRAYSAFAIGWALAGQRGFDQAPYEPRLPVLDSGEPEPELTVEDVPKVLVDTPAARKLARAGIWSKDPRIAYPCVSVLDYDQMSPLECARAVELVLAEGFRKGHAFNFSHFRSYVGSNELPAVVQTIVYARDGAPDRNSIFGAFHRCARAEHIPALLWFERNEDVLRTDGIGGLWQPFWQTPRYRDVVSGGDLWKDIASSGGIWTPFQWWLEGEPISEERESTLIELADAGFDRSDGEPATDVQQRSALRAMGRAGGTKSLRYLRWFSELDGPTATVALASLARRGDPDAMFRIVASSRSDDDALCLLLEVRPSLGLAVVRGELSDSSSADACASALGRMIRGADSRLGVRWDPDRMIGIEPAIPTALLDATALVEIIRRVPGCFTRRLIGVLVDRVENGPLPEDEGEYNPLRFNVAIMDSVAPKRVRARLRRECEGKNADEALELLARIQDPADEERIVKWVSGDGPGSTNESAARWGTPAIIDAFRSRKEPNESLLALSQCGFRFGLEDDDPAHAAWRAALLRGEGLAAARGLIADDPARPWGSFFHGGTDEWQPWMSGALQLRYNSREEGHSPIYLGTLAIHEKGARAEYWSAMRAGRYRWVSDWADTRAMTLGMDWCTLPFWAEELESNCCRINPRIDSMFDDLFGIGGLYSASDDGLGQPPSRRVRTWFELYGGEPRWSKLAGMCIPEPE